MNSSKLLLTLREEFSQQLTETKQLTRRDYQFETNKDLAHVAIGMRRTGKTYLLFQEIHLLLNSGNSLENILYLNFEDDRITPINKSGLAKLVDEYYALYPEKHQQVCYFFFDEIQNVEEWPAVIRRLLDSKKVKIYLTGSSAKMLSKEIASSLRGRSLTIEVWPYSFNEYCQAQHITAPKKAMGKASLDQYKKHLKQYLLRGGFPQIQSMTEANARDLLQNYVDVVIYRDIIERHHITNIVLIKYLVSTMLKYTASSYSPNKLFNDLKSQGFKVGKDTIYEYLSFIEDAFLAFSIPLYSESLRKTQVNPKKIYSIDSGLVNAYTLSFSDNLGRCFENLIYLDLRRKGHQIFYYKTQDNYEIDFFTIDRLGKKHLYQVVWDSSDEETLNRETRALKAAEKELGFKGKLIDPEEYLTHFDSW